MTLNSSKSWKKWKLGILGKDFCEGPHGLPAASMQHHRVKRLAIKMDPLGSMDHDYY